MIKKVKKGFTLIELVVVIAVIAILSAVSVVAYVGITNSAKKTAASSEASQIVNVVRGAVLANANGYEEQEVATGATAYKVTINGKLLSFKRGEETLDNAAKLAIIKDMLGELKDTTATPDDYKETSEASFVGVRVDDSKSDTAQWVSF